MHTDPIADMLTRLRNANTALHPEASMPSSQLKEEIAKILASEGYVDSYKVEEARVGKKLTVALRYADDRSRVIQGLRRVSTPGHRVYKGANEIERVRGGIGVSFRPPMVCSPIARHVDATSAAKSSVRFGDV